MHSSKRFLLKVKTANILRIPRSSNPVTKRMVPLFSGYFMEAVFRPEFFPRISDRFLPESTGILQESTEKNPDNSRPEYCFHIPAISGIFLQDPVSFLYLSCRILPDPVSGIFDFNSSCELNRRTGSSVPVQIYGTGFQCQFK